MKVSILTDDIVTKRGLKAEHGLSLFIEHDGKKILFDTGQSSVYLRNAAAMGIDLKSADCIVLSHGHYDHCGGLVHFPATGEYPPIFAHRQAFRKRYKPNRHDKEYVDIGVPWTLAGHPGIEKSLVYNRKALNPFPGVHILAEIPRTTEFEDAPKGFFIDKPEGIVPDVFSDEQMLVVETDEGLDVFLGCSHPGVINCLKHVMKCFPGRSIHALVAGMHLGTAAPSRIEMTIGHMAAMKIQKIVPLHCTGITAICEMKRSLKEHCFVQFTGDVLHI